MTSVTDARAYRMLRAGRCLLIVAVGMSAVYAIQIIIDLARPKADFGEPAIGLFGDLWPTLPKVVFWGVLASWVISIGLVVVDRDRRQGAGTRAPAGLDRWGGPAMLVGVLLLAPYLLYPLNVLLSQPGTLLVCLPSTALALWGVRRMQRFARLPGRLLLGLFGWGLLVATGFGGVNNIWVGEYSIAYFRHAGDMLQVMHRSGAAVALSAGVFEEAGKAAALVLLYLLARRHLHSVTAGIVAGAAVGLGFNLTESVEYMSAFHGASASFQYWMRQSVGLMAAHTAFTAVAGAGFAVATQLTQARLRRLTIGCGLLAAMGGHFANDALMPWLGQQVTTWLHPGRTVDVLLVQPLLLAVLQGPFVLVYALLLRHGFRAEAGAVARALRAEASTGQGAVADTEIPVLLAPTRRFWLQVTVLRRHGRAAYRALLRLHASQYELAAARAQPAAAPDGSPPTADALRERIRHARAELHAALAAGSPGPARIPA